LKAARRTAANAPVVSCWALALAKLDADADAAEADAEPAAEDEAATEEDAAPVAEELAADEEEALEPELPDSTALAFKVPHFSLLVQVACPSASLG